MRINYCLSLIFFILFSLISLLAHAETISVKCSNLRGNRIQFFNNPALPPDALRKTVIKEDAIDGAELQIIIDKNSKTGALIESSNKNTGGQIITSNIFLISDYPFISLLGIDKDNGNRSFISYFPQVQKLLWTTHNDRILFIDGGAVAKQFIADCKQQ